MDFTQDPSAVWTLMAAISACVPHLTKMLKSKYHAHALAAAWLLQWHQPDIKKPLSCKQWYAPVCPCISMPVCIPTTPFSD